MSNPQGAPRWALILGVSSGFGAECGIALAGETVAERGEPPCGVVRERLRREVAAIDARVAEL